jgi:hypothetical protein
MSNEFNIGLNFNLTNGNFTDPFSRQVTEDQAAQGVADNITTLAAISGSETLHGKNQKPSAAAATTTTLPACTYANGSSGVGATLTGNSNGALAAQDGITLVAMQKLLVKDQASGLQNGLYELTTVGDGSNPFVLTRVTAMDVTGEYVGASVYIEGGTVNAGRHYSVTNTTAPVVGTDAINFKQSAAGTVISQGNISTAGLMFIQNLDTTSANHVIYGPEIGGVMMPWGKVNAGKFAVERVYPGVVIRAIAAAGTPKVHTKVYEN